MSTLSFFSSVTAPIEILNSMDVSLGNATGFFYKRDDQSIYFVTNWHVVTGRHPSSPNSSSTGAIPTVLRLKVHKKVGKDTISKSQKLNLDITINNHSGNNPEWLEHPQHKFAVDLVVIKIDNDNDFKESIQCHFLSEYQGFQEDFNPSVMDDVFVVGYPWGLTGGDPVLPLYKRGSVASEPLVDHGNLPRLLIDCRTASVMSGSPVICAHNGFWDSSGKMTDKSVIGTVENFAGVYSGRLRTAISDEDTIDVDQISEIGVVWKRTALDEIVEHGVTGTRLEELSCP